MTTYYLSGPMRGKPDYNYPVFHEVEAALRSVDSGQGIGPYDAADMEILNPARNFDGDSTRSVHEYMQADFDMVLRADAIVLLPGWESSEGAMREVQIATWTGKRFMVATLNKPDGVRDENGYWTFHETDLPAPQLSPRAESLTRALHMITGDRNNQYGPPTQDFTRTAAMANGFGFQVNGEDLKGHHVAIFQILLKMSRLAWTPGKADSWDDTSGYAGCGFECAVEEAKSV